MKTTQVIDNINNKLSKSSYISKENNLLVEINRVRGELYIYYYDRSYKASQKAILKEINSKVAQEISDYFTIDLKEYGVVINDIQQSQMSASQKSYLQENSPKEIFLKIEAIISLMSIIYFTIALIRGVGLENENVGFLILSVFIFILSALGLILSIGKKLFIEDEIQNDILHNITKRYIEPIDVDDQIQNLEDKIDSLTIATSRDTLSIKIPEELKQEIVKQTQELNISVDDIVEKALVNYLQVDEKKDRR